MRAILFDLDGTLLDIDIDAFLHVYFGALGPVLGRLTGTDPRSAIDAVVDATAAMMRAHPGKTNREAFDERFTALTGVDLSRDGRIVDEFYTDVFPTLGEGVRPRAGAQRSVDVARECGFAVVVATNPIFPALAVHERMRWAGLGASDFSFVTTYENMHACKPDPAYYIEIAQVLGVDASECLMVGDDPVLDMGASDAGMLTYFVGDRDAYQDAGDHRGTLDDLAKFLPCLT